MDFSATNISICVATFRRPSLLENALASLGRLVIPEGTRVQIVVVDNDRDESARTVVDSFTRHAAYPVTYDVEPTQNIALARNRCLRHAAGEYVAFIDDDEVADPMWLVSLLAAARTFGAHAVLGPVLPILENNAPAWIRIGGFFERQRFETGTRRQHGGTGNALVKRDVLEKEGLQFDPKYGLTGGSDTLLFWQLVKSGALIVWCDEAVVSEAVPAERATVRWLLRRAYRGGQTYARIFVLCLPLHKRIASALKRIVLLSFAVLGLPICACLGKTWVVRCLQKVCSNAGQLSCGVAAIFEEYRTT
jgi:succinoglycan biosynthesis protein ExoM